MNNFAESSQEKDGRSSSRPRCRKSLLVIALMGMSMVSLLVSSDYATNSMNTMLGRERNYHNIEATSDATIVDTLTQPHNTSREKVSLESPTNTSETIENKSLDANGVSTSPIGTDDKTDHSEKETNRSPTDGSSLTKNSQTADRTLTIVVQLSGELGNQVHKIANGLCVQDHVENELGLKTKLVLRAQNHAKWKHAMEWTKEAFPKTGPFDFRAGNTEEFDSIHRLQERWMDQLISENKLDLTNLSDPSMLKDLSCSEPKCYVDTVNLLKQTWDREGRPSIPDDATISMPHIFVTAFAGHYCLDRMYEKYRDFFQIDESTICKQIPDPDESVLHLRNFLVEMPKRGKQLGFEQLGPNVTATLIFKDYQPGDKVAIISRFPDKVQDFINALKDQKGIRARYIEGQTGNQDFCFLMKAQKEIIGQKVSTFVSLAGILGDAKKVRLYSVESIETRTRSVHFFNMTFANEDLRKRIVYENYNLTHR
ncbi:unnamed protein product [Cylindrotheca closterium]|uniref:Uncharacterized protein n=1 Tax=Cylindrotheca closterium TaxID=2856 RepID=A0AAD2FPX9_9STRA|nr:unnamed protein product [Cylindrotheca closterium]